MSKDTQTTSKPRYNQRFEREAKALQKNIEKRKQQQKNLQKLKEDKTNGQN